MVRRSILARLFGRTREADKSPSFLSTGARLTAEPVPRPADLRIGERMLAGSEDPGPRRLSAPGNGQGAMEAQAGMERSGTPPVSSLPVERLVEPEREARKESVGVKPQRLAPQEELSLKISEGLSTLSGLLGSIDGKLSDQKEQRQVLLRRLETVPRVLEGLVETQRSHLEATLQVQKTLEIQAKAMQHTAESLERVPASVQVLGDKLDQHAQSGALVRESVENVGKSVRSLADGSQRAQNTLLAEFRRGQDEYRRRLEELVDRERKMYLVMAGIGLALVASLIVLIVKLRG
ncbi:MAG: hypothetical protein L0170_18050 [Acidobacteria bacterium]|nr:hypothetical protein [Acidobacteriota bacterium]